MALAKNTVTDKSSSSLFSFDFPHPSSDYSCTTMNLIAIDLEKMFGSSSINDNQNNNNNQLFDERFLNDFIDHHDEQVKPPPGFENFHQTTMNNSSDTMNLSQLLSSTIVADVEQPLRGTIRSSSSSTSDDQSQRTNNSYSILANSQIYSPKIPSQTSTSKHSLINSSSLSSTNSNNSTSRIPNYLSTDNRISSSSSSSSIDDALNAKYPFSSLSTINKPSTLEFNPEQQALQDNLNFLASMTNNESNFIANPIQEYIDHLNEICYQGFDNLNALIQEQKWVENFLNLPPTSKKSAHANHSSSSEVLIICEYFIYKCKRYQPIASQIFEYLANEKVELRLKELIFVFQSWKQAIHHAEQIHREEEKKFLLVYHHPQTYQLNKSIIQLAFNRLYNAIRQLNKLTEKTRATYQHATLNVFQTVSRQTPIQSAQFLSMQQDKSSFVQPLKNPPHTMTP